MTPEEKATEVGAHRCTPAACPLHSPPGELLGVSGMYLYCTGGRRGHLMVYVPADTNGPAGWIPSVLVSSEKR